MLLLHEHIQIKKNSEWWHLVDARVHTGWTLPQKFQEHNSMHNGCLSGASLAFTRWQTMTFTDRLIWDIMPKPFWSFEEIIDLFHILDHDISTSTHMSRCCYFNAKLSQKINSTLETFRAYNGRLLPQYADPCFTDMNNDLILVSLHAIQTLQPEKSWK